jgi:hypothetical protein
MNTYTPYRDRMCQKCGKKPYTFFITNPSNDVLIDPVSEYVCVDCAPEMFLTDVKPDFMNSTIKAPDLVNDIVFYASDHKQILALTHDGKIIVDGEPNEATKVFLEVLEREYGTLPQKLKEANERIVRLYRTNAAYLKTLKTIADGELVTYNEIVELANDTLKETQHD